MSNFAVRDVLNVLFAKLTITCVLVRIFLIIRLLILFSILDKRHSLTGQISEKIEFWDMGVEN